MQRSLADVPRRERLLARCAFDAASLLAYEVCGLEHRVAFGSLNCGRVSDGPDAIGSSVCFVANFGEQRRRSRGQIDAFVRSFSADGHTLDRFSHIVSHRVHDAFYLSRGSRRALAQLLDFVGDYSKASSL